MKIFFCETFDDGTVGGSHACMYNLIKHMDTSKFHFTVGFYSENIYTKKYKELGIELDIVPIFEPLKTGNVLLRKVRNWYTLEHKFQKYLEHYFREKKYDLVVLNNSIFTSLPYVRACEKTKIPLVIYERGIGFFHKKHIRATGKVAASIPVSDAVLQFLEENNFRPRLMKRIYDGIDPDFFQVTGDPGKLKEELGFPKNSRIIGIVGNIRPWKGQKYFVQACLRLLGNYEDLHGLIVGGCSGEDLKYKENLESLIREAKGQERVHFFGYHENIPRLLSIFDVFVHASTKPEPFGMVLLEAMAGRIPVIATNHGGPVEILNNGKCGILVPPKDPRSIEEGCTRYLSDPAFKQQMIDRAYERVRQEFHISRTVKDTTKLFRRIQELNN